MERLDEQKLTVEHHGVEFFTKAIHYDYGSYEEIDINYYDDYGERYHTKFTFRVTDKNDRVCRFRTARPTEVAKPDEVALRALTEYGWFCENFDIETLEKKDVEKFQPFLQYIDDACGTALDGNVPYLEKYPFLADLIEAGQSPLAMANGLLMACEDIGDGDRDVGLEKMFAEENRDTLRMHILQAMIRDPYNRLYLPALAKFHFDMEFDQGEMEARNYDDLPPVMQRMLPEADKELQEKIRPGSYGEAKSPFTADE